MVGEQIPVLDHGYIQLIESWGSDERIIESARMSTAKGFLGWGPYHAPNCPRNAGKPWGPYEDHCCMPEPGDERLLSFLWKNHHATPFEMAGATFEVQAPIFVFREWHRHRTQSYNELSARYTPLPDVNYVPSIDRCMLNSLTNKQAGRVAGADELTEDAASEWLFDLRRAYDQIEELYQRGLKYGIPKELARCPVPVGRYSRMRASTDLRNWLGFLTLRMDKGAQWEIRQYAERVHLVLSSLFPRTLKLFNEGRAK